MRAQSKLRVSDYMALFGKKGEREQRCENHGGASEDRINARAHVKQCDNLGDLMHGVGHARSETDQNGAPIEARATQLHPINDEWRDRQASDRIPIKILRPRIIIPDQVILEERWR